MMHYFAYGSNLDVAGMQERCPHARALAPGCLKGFRLAFTWYSTGWGCGVADVVESSQDEVWGLVYTITTADLDALDRYEGYPTCYRRSQTTIHTQDDTRENVWLYTVCEKAEFASPSRLYLNIMKRACADYGFPDAYTRMLNNIKVRKG